MTEEQRTSSTASLAYFIELAADDAGTPLKPGMAQRMASHMIRRLPQLLDAITAAAKGTVK